MINVAIDGTQWLKLFECFKNGTFPDVTSMPQLIAIFKVFENCGIEISVCIGKEPDLQARNDLL